MPYLIDASLSSKTVISKVRKTMDWRVRGERDDRESKSSVGKKSLWGKKGTTFSSVRQKGAEMGARGPIQGATSKDPE